MKHLWVLVLLSLACATGRVPHVPGDSPPTLEDPAAEAKYQEILERSTRHEGVYDKLDTKAFFYATWQSPKFVEARLARVATFKALPQGERTAMTEKEATRLTDVSEFFFATHMNDSHFDDFDRGNSMWRVVLIAHGEEFKALSIERLGRTNIELRSVYSYMESFWVGYRVRFPKVTVQPGETLTFRAASALGKADLIFTAE